MADYDNRDEGWRDSGSGDEGAGDGDRHGARRGGFHGKRDDRRRNKVCHFCVDKVNTVDYKNVQLLRHFVAERGRILPRRRTGACAKHQRMVSVAIKRARQMAMLPYSAEHVRETRG